MTCASIARSRSGPPSGPGSGPPREVRQTARDYVTTTFDRGGFLAIGVDIAEARSRASADDRVAVMVAAEDDVIAAVAAPFISEQVRVTLTTPMDRLHLVRGGVIEATADSSAALEARRAALRRASMIAAFAALVIASLVLIAIGSGIGAFGLAAAIGIGLVAVVVRGRVLP